MNDFTNDLERLHSADAGAVATANAFLNRVYGWMCVGLALTGGIAYWLGTYFLSNPEQFARYRGWFLPLLIAELVLVFGVSAAINRIPAVVAGLLFAVYAALNGLTLSWIFLAYTQSSVASTFFAASGMFGGVSLFGFLTKRDLSGVGAFCGMALWGIIIALIINMFWPNGTFSLVISLIGIVVFAGLTAWDTQKIKQLAFAQEAGEFDAETGKKYAVIGALELYLDFINLFLFLLRFLGNRR